MDHPTEHIGDTSWSRPTSAVQSNSIEGRPAPPSHPPPAHIEMGAQHRHCPSSFHPTPRPVAVPIVSFPPVPPIHHPSSWFVHLRLLVLAAFASDRRQDYTICFPHHVIPPQQPRFHSSLLNAFPICHLQPEPLSTTHCVVLPHSTLRLQPILIVLPQSLRRLPSLLSITNPTPLHMLCPQSFWPAHFFQGQWSAFIHMA